MINPRGISFTLLNRKCKSVCTISNRITGQRREHRTWERNIELHIWMYLQKLFTEGYSLPRISVSLMSDRCKHLCEICSTTTEHSLARRSIDVCTIASCLHLWEIDYSGFYFTLLSRKCKAACIICSISTDHREVHKP